MQASDRSPARTIVAAIPKKGRPRYDALRQLAKELVSAPRPQGPEHADPLWNLLHLAKEKASRLPGENAFQSALQWKSVVGRG